MIDSKELMLGNYVTTINRGNEIHVATGITEEIGSLSYGQVALYDPFKNILKQKSRLEDVRNLSPIPVSKEWLLKLGFEEKDGVCRINIDKIAKVTKTYLNIEISLNVNYCWMHGRWTTIATSIHQVQNLYFSLTKEHLKIKK